MYEKYASPEFESKYTYHGSDLGATWTRDMTCFRLWAPTASAAAVKIYRTGDNRIDDELATLPMTAASAQVMGAVA